MIEIKEIASEIIQSKKSDSDKLWMLARLLQRFPDFVELYVKDIIRQIDTKTIENWVEQELMKYKEEVRGEIKEFGKEVLSLKPKDGRDAPTLGEILSKIPKPKDGRDGKDGRDAPSLDEILSNVPEPKDGERGGKGRDGKNGSPDTGEQVIKKINSSKGKIDASRIKDLPVTERMVFGRRSGGGGGEIVTLSTVDSSIVGSFPGTEFTLTKSLKNPVVFARGTRKTLAEDYTISADVITFLSSQVAGPVTVDGQV